MNCEQARDLFSAYVEGELDDALSVTFKHHLSQCAECSKDAEALAHVWNTLGRFEMVEPPDSLHSRIMGRLTELEKSKETASPRVTFWDVLMGRTFIVPRRALVAVSTVMLALLASSSFIPAGRNWISALVAPGFQKTLPALQQDDISISVSKRPVEGSISIMHLNISPECNVEDAHVSAQLMNGIFIPHQISSKPNQSTDPQVFNWHVNLRKGEYTEMSVPLQFDTAGMRTLLIKVTGNDGEYQSGKLAYLPIRSIQQANQKAGSIDIYLDSQDRDIYEILAFLSATTKTPIIMETDLHGKVNVALEGDKLGAALSKVLTPLGYSWNATGRAIYIVRNQPLDNN